MAELNQTTYSLAEEFDTLPEAIKTWLASDHCTIYVSEINKKLGIKGDRRTIIPALVLRLVAKDLEPQDFIKELSEELNIGYPIAKSLAEEIEVKILHPIELGLRRDAGVDIKLIYLDAGKQAPAVSEKIPVMPIPSRPAFSPIPPAVPTAPIMPVVPAETEEKPAIAPRVIYKEQTLAVPPAMPVKPEIKPVSARIVHYSNLITPLTSPKAENDNQFFDSYVVDLRQI